MAADLFRNMASLSGLQVAGYLLPLVSVPYQVRVLGADGFGHVALALAVAQYFVLLTEYGFPLSATRACALLQDRLDELSRLASAVAGARLLLCLAGLPLMLALVQIVPALRGDADLWVLAYIGVLASALQPAWLLQGVGRAHVIAVCGVAGQIASLGALFLLVRSPADVRAAIAAQAGGALLCSVLAWSWIAWRRIVRFARPERGEMARALRDGWPFFLSNAAVALYTTTNTVLLGLLAPVQAVGVFVAAEKLIRAAQGLLAPVSQAIYPHVARLTTESRSQTLAFLHRLLVWQGLATFVVSVGILLLAGVVVDVLYGSAMADAAIVLRWLAPLPFVVGVSNVLGVQIMLNFGLQQPFSRILIGAGVVNVLLLLALVPWAGASGAALSVVLTECVVVGLMASTIARAGLLAPVLGKGIA